MVPGHEYARGAISVEPHQGKDSKGKHQRENRKDGASNPAWRAPRQQDS